MPTSAEHPFHRLGISAIDPEQSPEAYASLFRVARRLRESGHTIVGFMPADDTVATVPVALQLALALVDACDAPIHVVDANTRTPALKGLVTSGDLVTVPMIDRVFVTTCAGHAGGLDIVALEGLLERGRDSYAHQLVDLSGFDALGEQTAGYDLADGVVIVARSGKTKERHLLDCYDDVPSKQRLGVLLVG